MWRTAKAPSLAEMEARRMRPAPQLSVMLEPLPRAITRAPRKLTPIPIHPQVLRRSPRKTMAASAVQIGRVWMRRAAGPAGMLCSPMFSAIL